MNKILKSTLVVLFSVVLLIGASFAYFSDRATALFTGHTGTVEISSERPFAKMPAIYNLMNDTSLSVTNNGNKSLDIKVIATIETPSAITSVSPNAASGTHMLSTQVNGTNYSLPLYRVFDNNTAAYSVTYADGDVTESNGYLKGAVNSGKIQFEFNGVLNGHDDGEHDFETETGGVATMNIPMYIYFPVYDDANNWGAVSKDLSYTVVVKVYGKQHRNSDDNDWSLLGIVQ